jgi:LEA14-like dessication related protein
MANTLGTHYSGEMRSIKPWLMAIAIVAMPGCAVQPTVDVYLTNLKPLQSTVFEQRAELSLRFQNLRPEPLEVSGMDVRLIVNDKRLARGVTNQSFTIEPLAEATSTVIVSAGMFDTIRQLLGMRERQSYSYSLEGKLYTPGINRRFRRSGELSRRELGALAPNNLDP